MLSQSGQAIPPTKRMADYRSRMRAAGFRLMQVWVPDVNAPGFVDKCRAQSMAIAKHDPAGREADQFIEATYEWPN